MFRVNLYIFGTIILLTIKEQTIYAKPQPQLHYQSESFVTNTPINDYRLDSFNYNSKCTDHETGRELLVGDAFYRPGRCIRVQCLWNLQIWEDHCNTPKLRGNCSELPVPNVFLNYPQCCPLYECYTTSWNHHGKALETKTYDHYGILQKEYIIQEFFINTIPKLHNCSSEKTNKT